MLRYDYNLKLISRETPQSKLNITEQNHAGDLYFYLNANQCLSIRCEYTRSSGEHTKATAVFSDVTYAYNPSNSKITYKLSLRNAFDANTFTQYSYSDISLIENKYKLRPRELVLFV